MPRLRLTRLPDPSTWLRLRASRARVEFLTLFYNHHISWNYVFDTAVEPLLWIVDTFARGIGKFGRLKK